MRITIEEDRKMSIITTAERIGINKGKMKKRIKGLHESFMIFLR